ncbi:SMI1/KNR4 family protein [Streptomyces sp. NPDC048659]|uniref:SMI1/KNR4 family protein n=1 Tax=Streptomyces sp. NPDC048659 TaxID=3155489 RepID=UPI003413F029
MPTREDRRFPAALAAALTVRDGVDFEPFEAFLSADDTTEWLRAWTGDDTLDGDRFRVFGRDGTGGYAALWLVHPGREQAEQPVVFLGSEGETGVVARDLGAFLWLLADGLGPCEAVPPYGPPGPDAGRPDPHLSAVAEHHAPGRRAPAAAIVAEAAAEFPYFEELIAGLCR